MRFSSLLVAALALAACRTLQPPPPEELGLWQHAAGAVADPDLAALSADLWSHRMASEPLEATRRGDPRYHGRLPDHSVFRHGRRVEVLEAFSARAETIDAGSLSAADHVTLELIQAQIGWALDAELGGADEWAVDTRRGPHGQLLSIAPDQPVGTARERAQLVERWSRVPSWLKDYRVAWRRALQEDRVASRTAVSKVIAQLEAILETAPFDSPLVAPALGAGRWVELAPGGSVAELARVELGDGREQGTLRRVNHHLRDEAVVAAGTRVLIPAADDPLAAAERGQFMADVVAAVERDIYPALERTRDCLRDEILPAARPDERAGLTHVPGGDGLYRAAIRRHTTLDLAPDEIHAFGLEEVARIRAEIAEVGGRVFGTDDVAEIQRRLREDPAMHFETRAQVEGYAREAVARANAVLPQFFGILPAAACEVVRVPSHEERDTTIAYYRGPSAETDRPGRYFVNTYAPQTRPRYEAAVLAYHEAVPGHHLQIAIAQELEGLPRVRRHSGATAYVEGWALYTERLSDEMGLYSTDVDRLGVLSFDAWRACRLVVDTGLHDQGWSRQQAIDYLFENTLLAANNVENEVDRYIAWPGQALAYKLGQREILDLRDESRAARGDAFSYPEFHDVVLSHGAVTLPVLRRLVEEWLEESP